MRKRAMARRSTRSCASPFVDSVDVAAECGAPCAPMDEARKRVLLIPTERESETEMKRQTR